MLPTVLPDLETSRLRLRTLREADLDAILVIYGDPEVMRYTSDAPFPDLATARLMLASVQRLLQSGESLEWGLEEKSHGQLIGTLGLHTFTERSAEVGCVLAQSAWGCGYMSEALPALFRYAKDTLHLTRLRAEIDAPNIRSQRLFQRLGFTDMASNQFELALGKV